MWRARLRRQFQNFKFQMGSEGKKGHWKFEVKTKANKSRRAAIHLAMEMNRLRAKVKGRGSARRPPSGWYDFEKGLSHG